jgi:surfactin synthase thioesterase subunit
MNDMINKRQLFLFHFAGGSRYSFEFMTPFLDGFDIIALELPGRGDRVKETLTKDFEKAACDFFYQVLKFLKSSNFIFYGHSLGALLAFRVCQLLEGRNISPAYIVVSGNPGPGIPPDKLLHELDDNDFIAELKNLGGIPEEILENSDSMEFFLPILRSDFELAHRKRLEIESRINTPIYALMGDKEEHADEITNWKNFTNVDFRFQILEGNHFFILEQTERVAKAITFFN